MTSGHKEQDMQIPGFISKAAIGVALLASAHMFRAQDTVSISDPAEFNAYSAAVSQNEPRAKAAGLESFLTAYPRSVVKKVALDMLLDTYNSMGDTTHALSAASRLIETNPNNLKAIYVCVFIKKSQCEKNQDAKACNDAAALAQQGLAATRGAGVSDADWERQTAAAYPLFRSALAKVGSREQSGQSNQPAVATSLPATAQQTSTSNVVPQQSVGVRLTTDDARAFQLIQEAADDGVLKAQAQLGHIYMVGEYGVQQDYIKAAQWYGKAAAQGDAESEFIIGTFYETARGGFTVDAYAAGQWYNKAAEQGYRDAFSAMSRLRSQAAATTENPHQPMCVGGEFERIAYCKHWAADTEHIIPYCMVDTWNRYGGNGLVAYCTQVLTKSYGDCKGRQSEAGYCRVAATRDEAEIATRLLNAENEQQRRIDDFDSKLCTANDPRSQAEQRVDQKCIENRQHEAAEVERKENERKARVESVATDKASAGKHTTRYRGIYIGELPENAPIKQAGCSTDDWSGPEKALESIGTGKSTSECVVLISTNDARAIYRILVFTRTSFNEEYRTLVAKYGSPLPGRYSLVDGDVPNSVAWQTKDGTQIALKPDTLRERDNPGHAVPYTIIVYSSR
jgi:hypothetical protein